VKDEPKEMGTNKSRRKKKRWSVCTNWTTGRRKKEKEKEKGTGQKKIELQEEEERGRNEKERCWKTPIE
jgi:hypothetical protein